ncbi:MAG: hypothetical protein KGJ60_01990 [Verrucomicrobiota bacterium]|nr:hypothetical protein [Verrucomicrobiota bacterium]
MAPQAWAFLLLMGLSATAFAQTDFHAGPIFDQFQLTLDSGQRTEAAGPLFYDEQKGPERTWALPPFFSRDTNPDVESVADDFLYPLATWRRFGDEHRWQFIQLFSTSGGRQPDGSFRRRFTLFPIYFQQRSTDTNDDYTALAPFYGQIKDRLFRDDIFFVLFPLYGQTRKRDVVNYNVLYPFFNWRHGDGMRGWQVWPLFGHEHKAVTTSTNGFGETQIVGGHDRFFALWPVHFWQNNGIGSDNPEKFRADLPLYSYSRSPKRDATSVFWPFFNWMDDREKKYREWELPWPIVVVARGEGKTTTRVFPLFSRAHNDVLESDFYLWPLYKFNRIHAAPLDRKRTRILFYLYQNVTEQNTVTGEGKRRVDFWPLWDYRRDFNGNRRLQILAPLEPILPRNDGIERNWSPLWSLWREEKNPRTGAASRSLLWNLYRRDTSPAFTRCSLLFGLFEYQSNASGRRVRLFYIPMAKTSPAAKKP